MMPRSKPFTEDLRWVLIHMRYVRQFSVQEIAAHTGLKDRTIRKTLQVYKATGGVLAQQKIKPVNGKVGTHDSEYIEACVEKAPNVYLDELKQQREDVMGTRVSLATVWRTLRNTDHTMKKSTAEYKS
ncbi:hypothetical protein BJ138DRAFT_1156804 [Hygrophoropsis aurantiaca]|uniref:Uncharacterized protein n=1 Tax=Hygrophoropsis aurantiaca TaxID=72124 RepID=A0ACB8A801_9AGAM|nr:hypothetical protein BJ138DRAFT_1156804 [Hygrophoropsis aurantiaca]